MSDNEKAESAKSNDAEADLKETQNPNREQNDAEESPTRPVRMKWGRVIEEPVQEPAPKEEKNEPRMAPPKPDPRIEALRARLEREERASAEAARAAKVGDSSVNAGTAENAHRANSSANAKASASVHEPARLSHAEARAREEAERRRAEEAARMREELEREKLRRAIRRKRRKERFFHGIGAFFGGIAAFFLQIRISKKWVIAIFLTLVLSILAAVMLGNLLKSRVDAGASEESTSVEETESETVPYARDFEVPSVGAGIVSLEGATVKGLQSEAKRFVSAGVTAVSLILRDGDGKLLFSAKTDDALGFETETEGLLSISDILEPFLSRDLYVSCLFPVRYFSDGDTYSRSVLYAYETALLCEIAEAGAHEVVLLDADGLFLREYETDDPDEVHNTAEDLAFELSEIARTVNERVPEAAVGIALTPEFLATKDSDRYLGSITASFDMALLDLRALADAEDVYMTLAEQTEAHLYFIRRYSMRLLIPAGTAEAVIGKEIENWQEGTLPIKSAEESETVS